MSSLQCSPQICRWHRFDQTDELERAAATRILHLAQKAIYARGAFHIVLAGGSTPRKVYEALRDADTDWRAWHVYFGDERCLPRDHEERNNRMAAQVWLDHVAIPESQIHPIPTEDGAEIAAEEYARIVNDVAMFDLVLLGLGEDGHTASLFPGHDAGDAPEAPATLVVLDAPKPPPERVSLSARRLSASDWVMFLVTGSGKAHAVNAWRAGASIPASKITPGNGVDIYIERTLLDSTFAR